MKSIDEKYFPKLAVLHGILKEYANNVYLDNFYIVGVQHLMETTGSLIESFISIGFHAKNIFLTGKIYSTHLPTVQKLRFIGVNILDSSRGKVGNYTETIEEDVINLWKIVDKKLVPDSKIIILDDGGFTIRYIPEHLLLRHEVFGIEQTTSGLWNINKNKKTFPIINVAASAAKTLLEPRIVCEAVRKRIPNVVIQQTEKRVGIIGLGNIGSSIVDLFYNHKKLNIYDNHNGKQYKIGKNTTIHNNIDDVLLDSDIIIGTTGRDISNQSWLGLINSDKILLSLSSGDVEFNSLIKSLAPKLPTNFNPVDDIDLKIKNYRLLILRGGMVANFTGEQESAPANSIQLTRGLLLCAVLQILQTTTQIKNIHEFIMLSPWLQKKCVSLWFENQPLKKRQYDPNVVNGFSIIDWIEKKSEGKLVIKFTPVRNNHIFYRRRIKNNNSKIKVKIKLHDRQIKQHG